MLRHKATPEELSTLWTAFHDAGLIVAEGERHNGGPLSVTVVNFGLYQDLLAKERRALMTDAEREQRSYVYYVAADGVERVKIGRSMNPWARLKEMQVGSSHRLQIIALERGGETLEAQRHDQFTRLRVEGEWFSLQDDLVDHINTIATSEGATTVVLRSSYDATTSHESGEKREENKQPASLPSFPSVSQIDTPPPSQPSKRKAPTNPDTAPQVRDGVFAFWMDEFKVGSQAKLERGKKRDKAIMWALGAYGRDGVWKALKGYAADPWRHEARSRHEIATLLRDAAQVEEGLDKYERLVVGGLPVGGVVSSLDAVEAMYGKAD